MVQIVCNFTRCPPSNVFIEDTPDDFGFSFDNDPLALIAEDRNIAISASTCIKTLADMAGQTSAHLVGAVLAVEPTHESAKPNQYRIDHAFVDGSYFDAEVLVRSFPVRTWCGCQAIVASFCASERARAALLRLQG
jgi:hypothetical protein